MAVPCFIPSCSRGLLVGRVSNTSSTFGAIPLPHFEQVITPHSFSMLSSVVPIPPNCNAPILQLLGWAVSMLINRYATVTVW
eukprot:jgi/Botrbrau1/7249/Bobra.0021s0032.1